MGTRLLQSNVLLMRMNRLFALLVAGALLYELGSGPVKGFAVTLSIGVIISLFSAILVTRLQIVSWLRRFRPKAIPL